MFIVDSLCLSLPCLELNSQTFKDHRNHDCAEDNDDELTGWSLRNLEGLRQNCWKLEFILKFVFGDSNVLAMMIMMSEPS